MPEHALNEQEVNKEERPSMDNKAPDNKDSKPIVGPVMKHAGTIALFFGAVGVAILAIAFLAGYMGIYSIPALLTLGAVLTLGGHYLKCRKSEDNFSIVGAFQAA